jgi:hypothetical protein
MLPDLTRIGGARRYNKKRRDRSCTARRAIKPNESIRSLSSFAAGSPRDSDIPRQLRTVRRGLSEPVQPPLFGAGWRPVPGNISPALGEPSLSEEGSSLSHLLVIFPESAGESRERRFLPKVNNR